MTRILVVEDDQDLNKIVSSFLKKNDFDVVSCFNGFDGLKEINEKTFDLIVSDIMMPKMNGFDFAEEIRMINKRIPILFMTAREDISSKKRGYSLDIDDYMVKPIDNEELLMHINALLRRTNMNCQNRIKIGNFIMDKEEHTAYLNGEDIMLTVREFDILYRMLSYPKKTFSRSTLMELFWDYDSSATSRTVDVYMAKLREKTAMAKSFSIVTVHGLGYKVVLNDE